MMNTRRKKMDIKEKRRTAAACILLFLAMYIYVFPAEAQEQKGIAAAHKPAPKTSKNNTDGELLFQIAPRLSYDENFMKQELNKKSAEIKSCADFLTDLQAGRDIEILKPIIQTDEYNDPRLQAYTKRCPKKNWRGNGDEFDEYCYAFRLYDAYKAGDPEKGRQYFFYYEGPHSAIVGDGEFLVIDLKKCDTVMALGITTPTIDNTTKKPTGDQVGVLRYKGRYYLYHVWGKKIDGRYSLVLDELYKASIRTCLYEETTPKKRGRGQ